ncbi:MAG: PilN domain-containing protein [Planctomycetota bacterium]
MAKYSSNLIALALTRTALHLAEFAGEGASSAVVKRSVMAWNTPEGADGDLLSDLPDAALGEALRAHLTDQGYAGRRVAVGLPGVWVLARRWDVPPVEDTAVAGIVRLRTEKEFSSGPARLTFDFIDAPGGAERGVLLVGMREDRLAAVRAMLAAAGLEPAAIGVTALAAAGQTEQTTARCVMLEGPTTTLVQRLSGRAAALVSTSTAADATRWTADVSRLLATTPVPGEPGPLYLVDLSPQPDPLIEAGTMRWPEAVTRRVDPAEAVGRAALEDRGDTIDWLTDRMTPPRPRRVGRTAMWMIRVAAVLLLLGLVTGFFWTRATGQRDGLRAELQTIAADAERLGAMHERTRAAAGWFDERSPVLDCLLELTRTFPKQGEVWVTQFSFNEDRWGVVRGKAHDKESMLAYLKAIQRSAVLKDTELRDFSESGRDQRVIAFEITFRYVGDGAHSAGAAEAGQQIVDETLRPGEGAAG